MILFKKKDPICGMKQEKGRGVEMYGKWFCSDSCLGEYKKLLKKQPKGGCCH